MNTITRRPFLAFAFAAFPGLRLLARQAAPPAPQKSQTAPPPGGRYTPVQADRPAAIEGDEPGFESIFDGKTLNGWEGNPTYWRVEDGAMTGEITPETVIRSNTFIIWRGGTPSDFELKVDFRITSGGNSGINYRSVVVPDTVTPENKLAMRGYQFDIDGGNRYTGNNYEEKGRLFLAVRGQMTRITGTRKPIVVATLGDPQDLSKAVTPEWNSVHLLIRGNTLVHTLNGRVLSITIDDDPVGRTMSGLIGVQVHVGGAMKVQYRNWRLKNL
jgi:hypothetical protein